MSGWLFNAVIVLVTILLMEGLATAVHRYVMHGWGWGWHRSHHEPRRGVLEKNDLYALLFAALCIPFFTFLTDLWAPFWWVGIGITAYGVLYAILHDGLVHRRLPLFGVPRGGYLKRLVQAHRLHHAVRQREGAVSFGFLYAPPVEKLKRQLKARMGT